MTSIAQNDIKAMGATGQRNIKLIFYLLFVLVCVGLGFFNYWYNTKRFEDAQQQIIRVFEKNMKNYEQGVPRNAYRQVEAVYATNQKHQEEVKALLELQFNKIQNEYETQEVWIGILTIVFLIFSFYSLFKSEEMERQGKLALHSIEESEKGAQKALGSIETDKKKKLNEIRTEYAKWTTEENKKFGRIIGATQSKSIASMKSEIKKLTAKLESDYRAQVAQYMNTLKDNSDKNIETLTLQNEEQITNFIRGLEEKNAQEIQKQVDQWTAKMSELKAEYEKAINDIYEEYNPAQTVEDENCDTHPKDSNEMPVGDENPDNIVNSLDTDDELDEQLPTENNGTK